MATAAESDTDPSMIDRVYDVLDRGADAIGAALGVDLSPPAATAAELARPALPAPAAQREPFRVREVIDAATGKVTYNVTNGVHTSADCPSRAFAEQVLAALRAKGAR